MVTFKSSKPPVISFTMVQLTWVVLLVVLDQYLSANGEVSECGKKSQYVHGEAYGWPWQVELRHQASGRQYCGGSLISSMWILTAATCVEEMEVDEIVVSIGQHSTHTNKMHHSIMKIEEHSWYYVAVTDHGVESPIHDIALIKLETPVQYSSTISPVCLPTNQHTDFVGEVATVTAIVSGRTSYQEEDLTVISHKECEDLYNDYHIHIRDEQVCTYDYEPGKEACQEDRGGPLVWQDDKGHYQQIGVVSFGDGCANYGKPGIYTRITSYMDWIQAITKN